MDELTMSQFASKDDLLAAQAARIAELEAALEAAREDAARLDWLASEADTLWGSRDRGGYELPYFDITSGRECCDPSDLRAAIDQARGNAVGGPVSVTLNAAEAKRCGG